MGFHDVRFPPRLSLGSAGGPAWRTEIVTLANGYEARNAPWAQSRRHYDAGVGLSSLTDIAELLAFFEARRGRLFGFRWKDWADHRSGPPGRAPAPADQVLGTGDGATAEFALAKTYRSGAAEVVRPIAKPVAGTVQVALDGAAQHAGGDFEVDPATGIVRFAAPPAAGVTVTAGFEFDVPVRFDIDRIEVSVASFQAGEVPRVPVVEIRL